MYTLREKEVLIRIGPWREYIERVEAQERGSRRISPFDKGPRESELMSLLLLTYDGEEVAESWGGGCAGGGGGGGGTCGGTCGCSCGCC